MCGTEKPQNFKKKKNVEHHHLYEEKERIAEVLFANSLHTLHLVPLSLSVYIYSTNKYCKVCCTEREAIQNKIKKNCEAYIYI